MITISGPIPTVGIGQADTRCSVAPIWPASCAAIATAADDRWLRSVPTTIRSTMPGSPRWRLCFVARPDGVPHWFARVRR